MTMAASAAPIVVPDVTLDTENEDIKRIPEETHKEAVKLLNEITTGTAVADIVNGQYADRAKGIKHQPMFQCVTLEGSDIVAVRIKDDVRRDEISESPYTYYDDFDTSGPAKFLLIDDDYAGFFQNAKYDVTSADIVMLGLMPLIEHTEKVYFPEHVLLKFHRATKYLRGGKPNLQYRPTNDTWVMTVSAGVEPGSPDVEAAKYEEIIKYAPGEPIPESDGVTPPSIGPFNPSVREYIAADTTDKQLYHFLGKCHIVTACP